MDLRSDKTNCRYHLKGISVHKKFMAEGKASISFSEQKMMLLIFNAPPTQLLAFLRTMFIKLSGDRGESKVGTRTQLLSSKPSTLQEISPVTLQEVNQVKQKAGCCSMTPPGTKKRTLQGQEAPRQGKKSHMSLSLGPSSLTQEQKEVLNAALSGKNVFFTGSAGTGKSYLLRRIIGALPPDVTVATASTGVAACHIGGVTLHSFAGIGSGQASVERCIEQASRPQVQQAWRKCRHLIIDEISMVDGLFFEKLERVARVVRGNDRPFGGLQLILCGDFLQLPPVTREMDQKGARFCFQSPAWDRCVHVSFELNQVHRQSDPVFIEILQNVRIGRVTPEITAQLLATMDHKVERGGILATQLCSHMQDANLINSSRLNNLAGATRTFEATDSDPYLTKMLDQMTPVPSSLVLKVGAQVMLMKNINVADGMVNGARGIITSFDDKGKLCAEQH
ncbi:ATP-dependent DNA helicase PIF1 [Cryptotermes secundus]|uniref:ATP-dependent DNA helicase n=1 Tax=Cryptotermes secundus TaxID=105785 RepID=A0A2J7QHN7_9NEOP|nr:ATP-dependent DNA helicase PIF1 [Cryptotermes secundus]